MSTIFRIMTSLGSSGITGVVALTLLVGLLISTLRWVYTDAEARGKDGGLVALWVLLIGWPFSLFAWMTFRPELQPARRAALDLGQNRCAGCNAPIVHGRTHCSRCAVSRPLKANETA